MRLISCAIVSLCTSRSAVQQCTQQYKTEYLKTPISKLRSKICLSTMTDANDVCNIDASNRDLKNDKDNKDKDVADAFGTFGRYRIIKVSHLLVVIAMRKKMHSPRLYQQNIS